MLLSRKQCFVGISIISAIFLAESLVIKACSFQTQAVVFRVQFIILIECLLSFSSWIIFKTFRYVPAQLSMWKQRESSNMNGFINLARKPLKKCKPSDIDLAECDLQNSESFPRRYQLIWNIMLIIYLSLSHMSYVTNIFLQGQEPHWFSLLTYSLLGSQVQLVTGLCIFKLLSVILSFSKWFLSSAALIRTNSSNGIPTTYIALLAVFYMFMASFIGLWTTSQLPSLKHVQIQLKDLPSNLEGMTIVQLSDIHLGPTIGQTRLSSIVNIVNREDPDVVVLTGDLVDGSVEKLKEAAKPLSLVTSKYGNFFVSGNHEYYTGDVDNWFSYMRLLGFTILHNSNVHIPPDSSKSEGQLCMAGTDDITANSIIRYGDHGFDVLSAVGSCDKDRPVILLAHQPKAAKLALLSGQRIDLILSGHTHGGQMFPLNIGGYLMNPFFLGLYQVEPQGAQVYVNEGTQFWGIPMRIGTKMEITKITLAASQEGV